MDGVGITNAGECPLLMYAARRDRSERGILHEAALFFFFQSLREKRKIIGRVDMPGHPSWTKIPYHLDALTRKPPLSYHGTSLDR